MATLATAIPEDLLNEIFLRLQDPADLARISGTCLFFRSLATDRSFLRRYRKLHPPPVLGFLDGAMCFHPALPPHPSAPAAGAVALAADFSHSYLPIPSRSWVVQDVRDGRVLLLDCFCNKREPFFTDVAVCDPLYRQYLLLPSVPRDLAASVVGWCEPFFVPRGEEDDDALADETTFRVMWMADCGTKLSVFDFSSSTGQWRVAASKCWSDLFPTAVLSQVQSGDGVLSKRGYVYGCFYWVIHYWWEKMLELDIGKMEFSITDFPPGGWRSQHTAIVEAGEGRHGMIFAEELTRNNYAADLKYTIRQNNSNKWQMEKPISIPFGYCCDIVGTTEKHLVLKMAKELYQRHDFEYFSLDVKTLHMEKVCDSEYKIWKPRTYTNFPPSLLSSPTICCDEKFEVLLEAMHKDGENKTEKDGEDEDGKEEEEESSDDDDEDEDAEEEEEESSDDDYNQVSILELETLYIQFFDVGKWVLGGTWFWQKYLIYVCSVTSTNMKWIDQLCTSSSMQVRSSSEASSSVLSSDAGPAAGAARLCVVGATAEPARHLHGRDMQPRLHACSERAARRHSSSAGEIGAQPRPAVIEA